MAGSAERSWKKTLRWGAMGLGLLVGVAAYWPIPFSWDGFVSMIYNTLELQSFGYPPEGGRQEIIVWAQFFCPATICVFLLSWLSKWVDQVIAQIRSLGREYAIGKLRIGRDSVAIYGTGDLVNLASQGTHVIRAGNHFLKHAKYHIILMDNDNESMQFYKKHEAEFSKDNVCIGLQQMSSFLMTGTPNISYFNVYEEVARDYWKKHGIRDEVNMKPKYRIVILGYCRDNLGFQLLKYGIMNNLFRNDQAITYDIFCKPEEAVRGFEHMETMNGDKIVWHTEQWQRHLDVIRSADRILLCREINPHILNQLMLTCTNQQIDYYDPSSTEYPEKYAYEHLWAFGCTKEILNEDSMLKNKLYAAAMERHFQYTQRHGSVKERRQILEARADGKETAIRKEFWDKLSGFLKNSNAASSDYYEINPVKTGLTEIELNQRAELEHIRWCRFHFLCGWRYGEPEGGKRKDAEQRIHRSLQPWALLQEEDKEKDRQQILMEMTPLCANAQAELVSV